MTGVMLRKSICVSCIKTRPCPVWEKFLIQRGESITQCDDYSEKTRSGAWA